MLVELPSLPWPYFGGLPGHSHSGSPGTTNERLSADDYLLMEAGGVLGCDDALAESLAEQEAPAEEEVETLQLTISRRGLYESLGFGETPCPASI